VTRRPRHYCQLCGGPVTVATENGIRRDYCPTCAVFYYENPLPVVSTIVEVERSVLLVKRGKRPHKGAWCLPTGFAEAGEDIGQAALRELREEAGVEGVIRSLVDVRSYRSRFYGDLLFITFEVEVAGSPEPAPGSDTVGARFVPLDKVPALAFSPNRRALDRYTQGKAEHWAIVESFRGSVREEQTGAHDRALLSDRMVEVIEANADAIARRWLDDALHNPSTAAFALFDPTHLALDIREILGGFGRWLLGERSAEEMRTFYKRFGQESRADGIPLSQVLSALSMVRRHLWEFTISQGAWHRTIDIYRELELERRLILFFDRALLDTTRGYES